MRRIAPTSVARRADTAVEFVRHGPLHDLPDVLSHQPDDAVDRLPLAAAVVASLRLRLLVLEEALQSFADQLDDGVDDALLLELAVRTPAMARIVVVPAAAMVVAVAPVVPLVAVVAAAIVAVIVVAPIPAAVTTLAPVLASPGTRADQPLERFQPFEDLTSIVVPHGNPPGMRPTLAGARHATVFAPRFPRGSSKPYAVPISDLGQRSGCYLP